MRNDLVLTVEEAAGLLRISRGLAYEMVREGAVPTIRLGRRILVPREALDRMLASADRQDVQGVGDIQSSARQPKDQSAA